ncbi:hypothetical protein CBR_g39127 [Chara braunii]|uniref:Uncharacterized protein n=1 Tax=Chara braunii TaxID=69332 RepID=A0A388LR58_CHABU|nr:hypothetical protein CBR_g39127 [Chara braunii]|eukprot:GBG84749.1 hypothetical protein CBR_g39127 [Chara braunii]
MKVFDVRGNAITFQMLDPEKFLSKTNGYRVTGSLPVVDSTFLLSKPLVQFNSPTDQLAPVVMRYREQFARLPAAQQVDYVFLPIDAGSKRPHEPPAKAGAKRKQLPTAPLSSDAVARPFPPPVSPSDRQGGDAAEQSSEATNYDDGALRHLAGPQHRCRGGTGVFDDDESEGQEREGGGEEGDDGDERDVDGEDNGMDDERDVGGEGFDDTRFSQCGRPRDGNDSRACRGVDAYGGAVADGGGDQPGTSRGVSQSHNQARDGRDKNASRGKRKRGEATTSPANTVRDMRQWWIDNDRIEAPKAKVSEKDADAVAHEKKWQNFLRASMGKACDKAFMKQALDNEYSKDWSNKLRGYMNLATSAVTVWPLVKRFFSMFEEGKLPIGDDKIPLDMPGRMEGRLPGPYTDESKGQRLLHHCIYARDGPKGSTVSWKDLCPSYFKNFGDMTCREREVALLLLMKGKVVATNVKVTPPRVNTACLLDIMRKERYMIHMFNYVVFRAEGRGDEEWNDDFFMSYKDLEERDMYHKLGRKRLKVWEYLFRDAPEGRLDGRYIYKKTKVTETLKHYHGALTGAFETFVARCEILKFDLHKDQLMFKDYADLAKSGEGFNPVDSEEDSADFDLDIGNDTNATGWRGQSAAMEHDGKEYGPGRSEGCSNPPPTNSVASMVDRVACTPMEEGEDDELDIPAQATKLAPGDPIPHDFCADPDTMRFLEDKHTPTGEDKWGHDIIWHDGIFQPCIEGGEWKMAVKYVKGWKSFPRMGKDSWLKTTEQAILYCVRKENPGESENSITTKAKQLFNALRATQQLEYTHKFYELQTSPSRGSIDWKVDRTASAKSMEVDSREDAALVFEAAAGITKGEQREDVGTMSTLKPPLPEVGNTSAGKEPIIAISVEMGDTSQGGHVLFDKPSDAGATYGSLLVTGAAMAGRSEIVSESAVGMDITGMSLHPPSHTSKGDAHCTTTPQRGDVGDDGDAGNAEGSQRSRHIEDMTTDDEDGAEGDGIEGDVIIDDREARGTSREGFLGHEDQPEFDPLARERIVDWQRQGGRGQLPLAQDPSGEGSFKRNEGGAVPATTQAGKRLRQQKVDEVYGGKCFFSSLAVSRVLLQQRGSSPRAVLPNHNEIASMQAVERHRAELAEELEEVRQPFWVTGATILLDGRKSRDRRPIVNFLAAGSRGVVMYTTINREGEPDDAEHVLRRWDMMRGDDARAFASIPWSANVCYMARWVRRHIRWDPWWQRVAIIIHIMEPVIQLFRRMDRGGQYMSLMLEWAQDLVQRVKEACAPLGSSIADRIIKRVQARTQHMLEPAHCAGFLPNPRRRHVRYFSGEVQEYHAWLVRQAKRYILTQTGFELEGAEYLLACRQFEDFHMQQGRFGDWGGPEGRARGRACSGDAETIECSSWWSQYGAGAPELQRCALRVMHMWSCASPAEWNWAVHEGIHMKKRNRLVFEKVVQLVEITANVRLTEYRRAGCGYVLLWQRDEGILDCQAGLEVEPVRTGLRQGMTVVKIAKQVALITRDPIGSSAPPSAESDAVFQRRACIFRPYPSDDDSDEEPTPEGVDDPVLPIPSEINETHEEANDAEEEGDVAAVAQEAPAVSTAGEEVLAQATTEEEGEEESESGSGGYDDYDDDGPQPPPPTRASRRSAAQTSSSARGRRRSTSGTRGGTRRQSGKGKKGH